MYPMNHARFSFFVRHLTLPICGILAQAFLVPVSSSADPSLWALLAVRNTGYNQDLAAVSTSGPIYLTQVVCPAPTITVGDPFQAFWKSCVTKTNESGEVQYAVQISGAFASYLTVDSIGNPYITGKAGAGFETTPGAYKSSPTDLITAVGYFICKLDNTDGHALFCTFIDIAVGQGTFVTDSLGNSYLAAPCRGGDTCVEKLSSDGKSLIYETSLKGDGSSQITIDASRDLFVLYGLPLNLAKLDDRGSVLGIAEKVDVAFSGGLSLLALDPAGDPQLLTIPRNVGVFAPPQNGSEARVVRYKFDLSGPIFDVRFSIGTSASVLQWAIDSTGIADIVGLTQGADLPLIHPTGTCSQPTDSFYSNRPYYPTNEFLVRIGNTGEILQSTFLPSEVPTLSGRQTFMTVSQTGASLLISDESASTFKALDVGPTNNEVTFVCIGNAASLANLPLAPSEIVSLFGTTIGPTDPVTSQPGSDGLYPSQLGGVQVKFDGTSAPILYASGRQLNVVTPGALARKGTSHVCVLLNGAETSCIDAVVQPVAPGVFQSESGYAAAGNQDGTINSLQNPAPIGSVISIFVTGLGSMTPSQPDGSLVEPPLPTQDLPVQVSYAQTTPSGASPGPPAQAQILYAGPAPFEVMGLSQINFRVPLPAGPPVPQLKFLYLWIGLAFADGTKAIGSNTFTIWWTASESSSARIGHDLGS